MISWSPGLPFLICSALGFFCRSNLVTSLPVRRPGNSPRHPGQCCNLISARVLGKRPPKAPRISSQSPASAIPMFFRLSSIGENRHITSWIHRALACESCCMCPPDLTMLRRKKKLDLHRRRFQNIVKLGLECNLAVNVVAGEHQGSEGRLVHCR